MSLVILSIDVFDLKEGKLNFRVSSRVFKKNRLPKKELRESNRCPMQVRRCNYASPAMIYPVNVMWRDVYVAGTTFAHPPTNSTNSPVRRSAGTSLAWLHVSCKASCYSIQSRIDSGM